MERSGKNYPKDKQLIENSAEILNTYEYYQVLEFAVIIYSKSKDNLKVFMYSFFEVPNRGRSGKSQEKFISKTHRYPAQNTCP